MKHMLYRACSILIMVGTQSINSAVVIQGNDPTSPFGFLSLVTAKVYDRTNGVLYVGLENAAAPNTTGNYTIAKAYRPDFNSVPKFFPMALDNANTNLVSVTTIKDRTIEFLSLAPQSEKEPIIAFVLKDSTATSTAATPKQAATKIVAAITSDGSRIRESTNLNDAGGANTTAGIVNIASNSSYIFAAVRPTSGNFGDTDVNSGIALTNIVFVNNFLDQLRIKDAPTGLDGNRAAALRNDSTVLKGSTGTSNVVFSTIPADINQVAMYYDTILNRLYIGVRIASGSANGSIAKAVVAGRLSSANALLLEEIVDDNAIATLIDQIIVAESAGIAVNLTIKHIRVMHTSTGPTYLIINGGQGNSQTKSNTIYALPLVDDPSSPTKHGTLASKNASLVNFKFVTPATGVGEIPLAGDRPAQVGGPTNPTFPILASQDISDMVVIGDTVYASTTVTALAPTNDTGIFYSQALFDQDGKIAQWTPWTKRGVPFNDFPNTLLAGGATHDGKIKFFDVDAKTGNIWVVEGTTGRTAGITTWSTGLTTNGLIKQVSNTLSSGSTAVLDLDQSTRGFATGGAVTSSRYALFGGANKVIFTRVSQAENNSSLSAQQTVITDFSAAQNLLETTCPGCVQTLEYSRRTAAEGNQNYFFAGTEQGLFVFTDAAGNGFSVNAPSTLNITPFTERTWQKITTISGSVIDIKTSGAGNALYVLTSESTAAQPFKNTLYSIPFAATTGTMFASSAIRTIAQTGNGIFKNTLAFFGIQIIATGNPGASPENKEQLILATNQGLFKSNASQAGVATGLPQATTQAAADWQLIADTTTTMFLGCAGIDTPVRYTVWPISIQDINRLRTFERGSIHQLSGTGNSDGTAANIGVFVPANFNAIGSPTAFATFDPLTYFFSDGGRRFFIVNRPQDTAVQNKVMVSPFDVNEWNVGQPMILSFPVLQTFNHFFWVKQIGSAGLLLAGTNKGITGLE